MPYPSKSYSITGGLRALQVCLVLGCYAQSDFAISLFRELSYVEEGNGLGRVRCKCKLLFGRGVIWLLALCQVTFPLFLSFQFPYILLEIIFEGDPEYFKLSEQKGHRVPCQLMALNNLISISEELDSYGVSLSAEISKGKGKTLRNCNSETELALQGCSYFLAGSKVHDYK
ncbi:unnamed protein product [Dovyalis caffra]|uniref:Uncharacterized protein n=1 Tax=Dovyalis caffra TaxID=77055 RepID=A0AAV1RAD8_9ROSI|nr:unnamed protein product [Dovyalis caffra]